MWSNVNRAMGGNLGANKNPAHQLISYFVKFSFGCTATLTNTASTNSEEMVL